MKAAATWASSVAACARADIVTGVVGAMLALSCTWLAYFSCWLLVWQSRQVPTVGQAPQCEELLVRLLVACVLPVALHTPAAAAAATALARRVPWPKRCSTGTALARTQPVCPVTFASSTAAAPQQPNVVGVRQQEAVCAAARQSAGSQEAAAAGVALQQRERGAIAQHVLQDHHQTLPHSWQCRRAKPQRAHTHAHAPAGPVPDAAAAARVAEARSRSAPASLPLASGHLRNCWSWAHITPQPGSPASLPLVRATSLPANLRPHSTVDAMLMMLAARNGGFGLLRANSSCNDENRQQPQPQPPQQQQRSQSPPLHDTLGCMLTFAPGSWPAAGAVFSRTSTTHSLLSSAGDIPRPATPDGQPDSGFIMLSSGSSGAASAHLAGSSTSGCMQEMWLPAAAASTTRGKPQAAHRQGLRVRPAQQQPSAAEEATFPGFRPWRT